MRKNEHQGHFENAMYNIDVMNIGKMMQVLKSHQCALDFDRKFIKKELDAK